MDTSKDYYAILGVLPSIEQAALGAVYRALVKKYHPDVFSGSKAEADRITKELNEAYAILGNVEKRADYDRSRNAHDEKAGDYERQAASEANGESRNDEYLNGDWAYVVRYHQNAEEERKMLARMSRALAFEYQMVILETKNAEHSHEVSARLKSEFLRRYFGSSQTIHEFVLSAIADGRRDVALEVNRAIKVLGTPSVSSEYPFMHRVAKNCSWVMPSERWEYGSSHQELAKEQGSGAASFAFARLLMVGGFVLAMIVVISLVGGMARGKLKSAMAFGVRQIRARCGSRSRQKAQ